MARQVFTLINENQRNCGYTQGLPSPHKSRSSLPSSSFLQDVLSFFYNFNHMPFQVGSCLPPNKTFSVSDRKPKLGQWDRSSLVETQILKNYRQGPRVSVEDLDKNLKHSEHIWNHSKIYLGRQSNKQRPSEVKIGILKIICFILNMQQSVFKIIATIFIISLYIYSGIFIDRSPRPATVSSHPGCSWGQN